jgi:hypothetical protein
MGAHLTGEDDLLELAGADALDGALDGLLIVRGRGGARHARSLDGVGVEEGHVTLAQLPGPLQHPFQHAVRVVVGMNDGGDGHARLSALPDQRQLRQHEERRRQPGPFGRRSAVAGEGEAAHEDGAGGGRAERVLGGIVGEGGPCELAGSRGHLGEPVRPRRVERHGLAQPGEHEAVAVGLLEAGVAVIGPPSRQNGGTEVELGCDWHGHGRERRFPRPPRMRERVTDPVPESADRGRRQAEAIICA